MRVRFGECVFDAESRQLFRGQQEVHLSPKAFELLRTLVERRPRAMSKNELHERVWPATFVSDDSLARLITEIRAAIGDEARDPRLVRTVHGFGYAFADVPVEGRAVARPRPASGRSYWLLWEGREVSLAEGENLIGRDPEATVRLDSPRISRQHARILIEGVDATLEDLGSKNGTFLRSRRIEAPARLEHGDEIRMGSFVLTFRVSSASAPTETEGG